MGSRTRRSRTRALDATTSDAIDADAAVWPTPSPAAPTPTPPAPDARESCSRCSSACARPPRRRRALRRLLLRCASCTSCSARASASSAFCSGARALRACAAAFSRRRGGSTRARARNCVRRVARSYSCCGRAATLGSRTRARCSRESVLSPDDRDARSARAQRVVDLRAPRASTKIAKYDAMPSAAIRMARSQASVRFRCRTPTWLFERRASGSSSASTRAHGRSASRSRAAWVTSARCAPDGADGGGGARAATTTADEDDGDDGRQRVRRLGEDADC